MTILSLSLDSSGASGSIFLSFKKQERTCTGRGKAETGGRDGAPHWRSCWAPPSAGKASEHTKVAVGRQDSWGLLGNWSYSLPLSDLSFLLQNQSGSGNLGKGVEVTSNTVLSLFSGEGWQHSATQETGWARVIRNLHPTSLPVETQNSKRAHVLCV